MANTKPEVHSKKTAANKGKVVKKGAISKAPKRSNFTAVHTGRKSLKGDSSDSKSIEVTESDEESEEELIDSDDSDYKYAGRKAALYKKSKAEAAKKELSSLVKGGNESQMTITGMGISQSSLI